MVPLSFRQLMLQFFENSRIFEILHGFLQSEKNNLKKKKKEKDEKKKRKRKKKKMRQKKSTRYSARLASRMGFLG
jgi:hypothetical protein